MKVEKKHIRAARNGYLSVGATWNQATDLAVIELKIEALGSSKA